MTKKSKSVMGIFAEASGLYFSNLDKFFKYMTFPVLGQIAGLIIIGFAMFLYSSNMPRLIDKYPDLSNFGTLITIAILVTLPGLIIFCKAFWEYLVAYGAVNSMLENLLKSGRVYDFEAHTELIKRRSFQFIGLWCILGLFTILGICPLFWIICGVLAIYFILAFQVFTFEPEASPTGCLKKSFAMVRGHFLQTFILMSLAGLLTYIMLPQIILAAFNGIGLSAGLSKLFYPIIGILPELNFEKFGIKPIAVSDIGLFFTEVIITQIIIQYTLPLRSILWAIWYKELDITSGNSIKKSTVKRKSSKKPSEKLMEKSHKKFSQKKIDDDIIRRATEKDEDE